MAVSVPSQSDCPQILLANSGPSSSNQKKFSFNINNISMDKINYFMWEYQSDFHSSAKITAEGLFSELDRDLVKNVFLIGVFDEDLKDRHPICLEPEDCGFEMRQFIDVKEQAHHLEATDEQRFVLHSHPIAQEGHRQRIKVGALHTAVQNAVRRYEEYRGIVSHCSWPVPVNGYQVIVVLQFNREAFYSHYSLAKDREERSNFKLFTSLLDAAIREFFDLCEEELQKREPYRVKDREYDEIIRSAGRMLMYTPSNAGGEFRGLHGLFDSCNEVSSLKHEGDESVGEMLIAKKGHSNVQVVLSLTQPVSMRNHRAVRKLIEVSSSELSLLSDSGYVYGLGQSVGYYDRRNEDLFLIRFVRHYTWELFHDRHLMMQVKYGQPSLPQGDSGKRTFETDVRRIFSSITAEEISQLWKLTTAAASQRHGTIVVISSGAEEEANRLKSQAIVIKPFRLTQDIMGMITAIDGAVLVDPSSTCHAIGVILDGTAANKGDPSRGARFNSAIRYVESKKKGHTYTCLVIVVSEDGTVDLVPNLMPQISKLAILEEIEKLAELRKEENFERKQFYGIMDFLSLVKFYLLEEMCDRINQLRREIEPRAREGTDIWRDFEDFVPNEDMNETYFLDETEQS